MARKQAHRRDGIYERKDRPGHRGSWTDASGRRRRRQFDVPTLEEAKAALAAEKHKVEEAIKFGKPLPSEDSFEAFADEFLKYQEKRISPQVAKGKLSQDEYDRQQGHRRAAPQAVLWRGEACGYPPIRCGAIHAQANGRGQRRHDHQRDKRDEAAVQRRARSR